MDNEQQLQDTDDQTVVTVGPPWMRRRRRNIVRRVGGHMETRLSFSVLTLCTMGLAAAAILLISGVASGTKMLVTRVTTIGKRMRAVRETGREV